MAAPGQDAAQPDAGTAHDGQGQGQDRTSQEQGQQYSVLGEDAFNDAPEELRDHLVNYVRTKVDPALTQKFQEAGEFRQTWEPFSQIEGLTDLGPEGVDGLVEFAYTVDAAGDENHPDHQQAIESLYETWQQMAEQFGFWGEDEDGDDDGGSPEDNGNEPEYLTAEEFERRWAEREQQEQRSQTVDQIHSELTEGVKALELPNEKAEKAVWSFMQQYADDPNMTPEQLVQAAYEDYQEIVGGAQSDLIEETEERPTGNNLRGGKVHSAPEDLSNQDGSPAWKKATEVARARMAAGA